MKERPRAVERLRLRARRMWRGRDGAAYLEFALIGLPLLLLFFGILDLGLIFGASYDLENATACAARLVRTGQVQNGVTISCNGATQVPNGAITQAQLVTLICSQVVTLSSCASSLQLSVQTFPNFAGMTAPNPVSKGKLGTSFPYSPGLGGQAVLVNAYYEWTLVSPLTRAFFSNLGDGNYLLQSAAVFQNEPF